MALSVGTLVAFLKMDAGGFTKGAAEAAKSIEKISRTFERLDRKASRLGLTLTAPIVLALREAAKHSEPVRAQMDRVTGAFNKLAVEVATSVLPIVKEFANTIASVAKWLQDLDPHTKQVIFGFIEMAAKGAVVLMVMSKMFSLVSIIAKVATLITGPLLVAAGAVIALGVLAGLLREAWEENLGGIREKFAAVWKWMTNKAPAFANSFIDSCAEVTRNFMQTVQTLVAIWRLLLKRMGKDDPFEGVTGAIDDLAKWIEHIHTKSGFKEMWDDFQDGASKAYDMAGKGAELLKKDLMGALGLKGFKGATAEADPEKAYTNLDSLQLAKQVDSFGGLQKFGSQGAQSNIGQAHTDEVNKMFAKFAKEDSLADLMKGPLEVLGTSFRDAAEERNAEAIAIIRNTEGIEAAAVASRKFSDGMAAATNALISKFTARMGRVAELMETATQGAAAGGPWGALIAVVVDLLTSAGQFMETVDILNQAFQNVANIFGRLFASGNEHMAAFGHMLEALANVFGPIFDVVSEIIGTVTPILDAITTIFDALAPLGEVVKTLLSPLVSLSEVSSMVLVPVFKALGIVVMGFSLALSKIVNAFIQFAAWIVGLFNKDAGDKIRSGKLDTDAMEKKFMDMVNGTDEVTRSQYKNKEAIDKATSAMLNVPQGFKVAMARFQAINAGDVVHSASAVGADITVGDLSGKSVSERAHALGFADGGFVNQATAGIFGEAGPEAVVPLDRLEQWLGIDERGKNNAARGGGDVHIHVHGITNAEEFARKLGPILERKKFRGGLS